jgi:hypothetical protein
LQYFIPFVLKLFVTSADVQRVVNSIPTIVPVLNPTTDKNDIKILPKGRDAGKNQGQGYQRNQRKKENSTQPEQNEVVLDPGETGPSEGAGSKIDVVA